MRNMLERRPEASVVMICRAPLPVPLQDQVSGGRGGQRVGLLLSRQGRVGHLHAGKTGWLTNQEEKHKSEYLGARSSHTLI